MQIIDTLTDRSQYRKLLDGLKELPQEIADDRTRNLCTDDLFFLLVYGLKRKDADRDWIFDRCREVQRDPNGHLDLWSREHYKSSIITFALTIQNILNDPEITVGIFSHTRPIAKGFLRQIKREFEGNAHLKELFPEILWANPDKEAPKWSEDDGLIVKRKGNPVPATVEAWGIVDAQPIGRHFSHTIYDDVVTAESVTSPDMIAKVVNRWELSLSLGIDVGDVKGITRYIGTRYHFNDCYKTIMDRGVATPRIHPVTLDGTVEGEPALLTREDVAEIRQSRGPYTFACQYLLNPVADEAQGFQEKWLRWFENDGEGDGMNKYILVDSASEKKRQSDYTAVWVVGLGGDRNYYLLDFYRDRLNLTQRADLIFKLHTKWQPDRVGYEKYGQMSDIEHMKDRMERDNYRFEITPLGGQQPKLDRIRRLVPLFESGRIFMPRQHHKTDYEGIVRDLVQSFVEEEFKAFPVGLHDDMLDALSRILDEDMNVTWPMPEEETVRERYQNIGSHKDTNWMTA